MKIGKCRCGEKGDYICIKCGAYLCNKHAKENCICRVKDEIYLINGDEK